MGKFLALVACLALGGCAAVSPVSYHYVNDEAIEAARALCASNGGLDVIRFRRYHYPRTLVFEGECRNGLAFYQVVVNDLPHVPVQRRDYP